MNDHVRGLVAQIHDLEEELRDALHEQKTKILFEIQGRTVRFDPEASARHRTFQIGTLRWLASSDLRNVLSAPFVYGLFFPMALYDLCLTIYQAVCFRLYRIPRVDRSRYIVIDRHHLSYLNTIEKLNCAYCGYGNGLLAYATEITSRTEQYWCPIKHAHKLLGAHKRYADFLDYGDAEGYQSEAAVFRQKLRESLKEPVTQRSSFPSNTMFLSANLRLMLSGFGALSAPSAASRGISKTNSTSLSSRAVPARLAFVRRRLTAILGRICCAAALGSQPAPAARPAVMGFLSWFFGRRPAPAATPPPKWPITRTIAFEWREAGGSVVSCETKLLVEEDGGMTTTVPQVPEGDLANVREESSSYPVEIRSRRRVPGGFELKLGYLWEGRRREKRMAASGPAWLETEGKSVQAEVINVSSGGMQLFLHDALKPGNTARIRGAKTERLALIRYCTEVPGGYYVGLQFFGDSTPPAR